MKNLILFACFMAITLLFSCKDSTDEPTPNPTPTDTSFVIGKNRFTIMVDGVEREYYVHVPKNYNKNLATPLVFMLHGTSGNGEEFYDRSGWKEVGEDNNFLTVFPSSMKYCIIDAGVQKNITKWNSQPSEWSFCAGEIPRDDIKFLRTVIIEMQKKFNIDSKRVYMNGFSNGGQMTAKCAIEMSDVLAAAISNAASFSLDTTFIPKRILPVTYQVGNADYGPGNVGPEIPLSKFDTIISTPNIPILNGKHYRIASAYIKSFNLNPDFKISGDTNSVMVASYSGKGSNPLNIFRYVFVKSLDHSYPNGINHPMEAAKLHWIWLKQFSIP